MDGYEPGMPDAKDLNNALQDIKVLKAKVKKLKKKMKRLYGFKLVVAPNTPESLKPPIPPPPPPPPPPPSMPVPPIELIRECDEKPRRKK